MKKFVMLFGILSIMSLAVNSYAQVGTKLINTTPVFASASKFTNVQKSVSAVTTPVNQTVVKPQPVKLDFKTALKKLQYDLENLDFDNIDKSKIQVVNGQTFFRIGNTQLVLGAATPYAVNRH